jgi:hypothetical protein
LADEVSYEKKWRGWIDPNLDSDSKKEKGRPNVKKYKETLI